MGWRGASIPPPCLLLVCLLAKIRGASKLNIASRNAPTTQKWDMALGPWLVSEACPLTDLASQARLNFFSI